MKTTKEEAIELFSWFYGGEHHFTSELKPWGDGWVMSHLGELSTFDFSHLTRLVLYAHKFCFRISVKSGGPNRIQIIVHKRMPDGKSMYARHPTIEEALESFNKTIEASV